MGERHVAQHGHVARAGGGDGSNKGGTFGMIGGVLGLIFGIALTRIFITAMGAISGYALDFVRPMRAVWLSIVVALVISQIAVLMPAAKAARTPVLRAIQHE